MGYSHENWDTQKSTPKVGGEGYTVVAGAGYFEDEYLKSFVDAHNWESDTIIIGDLPDQKLITVDLRSAKEKLDLDHSLDIGLVFGQTTVYAKKLKGEGNDVEPFYWLTFSTKQNNRNSVIVMLVQQDLDSKAKIIGYTHSYIDEENDASGAFSSLQDISKPLKDNLEGRDYANTELRDLLLSLAEICDGKPVDVAVRVVDEYKGKGYGKLLWLLSLASLEFQGARSRTILSDLTRNQRPDSVNSSFYAALGAKPILFLEEIIGTGNIHSIFRLVAPTYLTDEQIKYLNEKVNA